MCSRVWSVGVERKKECRGKKEFMECQEHPFHKGKLPAARVKSPLWECFSSLWWILAIDPNPGCLPDV